MKIYKVGDIVKYVSKDFDGIVKTKARVIEVCKDYALAEEIDTPHPMKLYIDDDTEKFFSSIREVRK